MKGVQLSWLAIGVAGAGLLLLGAGGGYLWLPRPGTNVPAAAGSQRSVEAPEPVDTGPLPDVVLDLSDDAIARAGVVVSPVTMSSPAGTIRLSGLVEPNAYRQVVVAPLVSGRVTGVAVGLGEAVARNAPLVEIYSPDLAEAQTRFLSMRAEFQAGELEIARTTRLVEIGAASRQELERIHAEQVSHRTEVESARARLRLLGMTAEQIEALTSSGQVSAATTAVSPIAGVVTARTVNPGSSVEVATPLVTVVDLSNVWVVGDLLERDLSRVSVGARATVTTAAFPDQRIEGTVSYIDPQVRSETRTAKIRIEVPNPGQKLRLAMYAVVDVETARGSAESVHVPRTAVQNIGNRTVLFLADPDRRGRFIEREVRLGEASGDSVAILGGVGPGDRVVTNGSFSLRAERERLGLRPGQ